MRSTLLLFLTVLMATVHAKTELVSDIVFAGSNLGKNTMMLADDGSFSSTSVIKVGPTAFTQEIQSTFKGGKFGAMQITTIQGAVSTITTLKGKEVITKTGENTEKMTLPKEPTAIFGNWHPQLARTLVDLKPIGEDLKGDVLVLDAMAFVPGTLKTRPARIAKLNGNPFTAEIYSFEIGGTNLEIGTDPTTGWVMGINVPSQRGAYLVRGIADLFVDPLNKYPELSQPTEEVATDTEALCLMRDGIPLRATIAKPKGVGKFPTILVRTPYGRAAMAEYYGSMFAPRGYAVVAQDVRGMGGSFGEWDPFMNERRDGYDTIQWVAKQPWSNGKVGMIGGSYAGMVQWQAAVEQPQALQCIIPQVSPPDPFYNLPYDHGTFMLRSNAWWTKIVSKKATDMSGVGDLNVNGKDFMGLPLSVVDNAAIGFDVPFWDKWLSRDSADKWLGANYQSDLPKVKIPCLMVSGWWDGDLPGTTMNWQILRNAGHEKRWLIMGPWAHAFNTATKIADEDYGSEALLELDSVYLRFFDTFLKGKPVHFESRPRAQIFLSGSNEWRSMNDYPHTLSNERRLYLSSKRNARNEESDGTLQAGPGVGQSSIEYDPAKVLMKSVGPAQASFDLAFSDLPGVELYFKSESMTQPLDITGPINLEFSFKSTAQDCDFYAFLMDVTEKGTPRLIQQGGKLRASYIKSMSLRTSLIPGEIYRAKLSLWDVAHTFKPGHRIGVVISCNLFPTFDRNLGYADPLLTATRMRKSKQTILHNKEYPAFVSFQVLPPLE